MIIRIAHLVNPIFGSVFSGHTHYLFSLLSGWKDRDISLDLYGTQIKPLNLNSGDRDYCLPKDSLWSSPKRQDRWGRICWAFELLGLLIKHRKDYDIAHFHTLNWGALISPLILHPFGKKVVFTMSLFGNDNPSYIRHQPRGRLQIDLMRKFDGAIGLAPALVDDAIDYGIRNVICLPNFLAIPHLEEPIEDSNKQEVRALTRAKLEIPRESKVLLFVGSIIKRKGVDLLVHSFIELAKKYPNLVLVLVGPNSKAETDGINEDYVNQLKEEILAANLQERVLWAGMIKEQATLVEYYLCADIFVFPTRNEGLGNVLIEAMAAGLPVVASHLPGITDTVVADGVSGYLIEPENISKFIDAIDELLQDETKWKAMAASGRRIALEKFGFDAYCQKLKRFYLDTYYGIDSSHG